MSSISSTSGTSTNYNRITGLATGLDTENIVKQLMQTERIPLDRLYQQKQKLEWQRDSYRDMTNLIRGFRDDFLSVLKPASNMLSDSSYFKFTSSSDQPTLVTATGTATATAGSHKIVVKQLAKKANVTSGAGVSKDITGSTAAALDFTDGNNQINVILNGVAKTISLRKTSTYTDATDLVTNATDGLQKLLDDAFGAGKVTASVDGSGILSLTTGTSDTLVVSDTASNNALAKLGLATGASNKVSMNTQLKDLTLDTPLTFDSDNQLKFNINGVDFAIDSTATMGDLINKVNSSTAGVTLQYSELTDTFTMTSKVTGAANGITITNTGGNLFDADPSLSAIGIASGAVNNGVDAIFNLDGTTDIARPDNSFTIDGVKYNLLAADPGTTVNIGVSQDVDSIYNNIKSFVDKYNELVSKINDKLDEEVYRNYKPLTDAQKEEMTDDQITKWEEKAKSGILHNDSLLDKFVSDLRKALFQSIDGVSGMATDIGIDTGDWREKGQIVIDETKLKKAIASDPNKVRDIFVKESSIDYSPDLTADQRKQRNDEEGIIQRFNDIISDNIRTSRNSKGKKGILIEKAGVAGMNDISEYTNTIDTEINKTNTRIATLTDILNDKEEAYYKKYSDLETAISKMNQQSAWLTSQFSTGG